MTERTKEVISENIKQILNEYVQPYVEQHGGEVRFVEYDNGRVKLEMSGACSGCSGSTATLQFGIKNLLTNLVPEVNEIEGFDDPYSNVAPYMMSPYYDEDIAEVTNWGSDSDTNS
jgi:Fe-S cluster biogenesis protein NfuA